MLNFEGTTHMKLNHTCANCFEDIQYYNSNTLKHAYYDVQTSTWISETVDPTINSGSQNDIAIDINGDIHIAYYSSSDSDLKYAYFDGSQWSIIIVDGLYQSVGQYPSIEVDADHVAHITYYDYTNHQLKHATISH
ncbi:MAG TPA: hypothetical protein PLW31_04055 [Bacteroidales bacterium]|nr:hypothetical protein [Bacteroidales bacterium]